MQTRYVYVQPTQPLLAQRVAPKTKALYCNAALTFLEYYNRHVSSKHRIKLPIPKHDRQRSWFVTRSQIDRLDRLLCLYLDERYREDSTKSSNIGSGLINGLVFLQPQLKHRLPWAHEATKGWRRRKPWVSKPPIPWDMTCLVALVLVQWDLFDYAIATLLAFDCYLRISELANIAVNDLLLPGDHHCEQKAVLRLAHTKTGPNKFVILRLQPLNDALRLLRDQRRATRSVKLFSFSIYQYRLLFKHACSAVGLDSFGFRPHSLRHGGASHDFLNGKKAEEIQLRGRWVCLKSCSRYLQSGKAVYLQYLKQQRQQLPIKLSSYQPDYVIQLLLRINNTSKDDE